MLRSNSRHRRNADKLTQQLPITAKLYKQRKYALSRTCDGLIAKKFPYLSSYRYEADKRGSGENIIFTRKMASSRAKTHAQERQSDEEAQRALLVADMMEVTGDKHSQSFFDLIAKKLRQDIIYRAISATRQAKARGEIKRSPARYFTGLIQKLAREAGVEL